MCVTFYLYLLIEEICVQPQIDPHQQNIKESFQIFDFCKKVYTRIGSK